MNGWQRQELGHYATNGREGMMLQSHYLRQSFDRHFPLWPQAEPMLGGRSPRYRPICLAMISFMISRVPPPMERMRLSRYRRSTRLSRIKPMPPSNCTAS